MKNKTFCNTNIFVKNNFFSNLKREIKISRCFCYFSFDIISLLWSYMPEHWLISLDISLEIILNSFSLNRIEMTAPFYIHTVFIVTWKIFECEINFFFLFLTATIFLYCKKFNCNNKFHRFYSGLIASLRLSLSLPCEYTKRWRRITTTLKKLEADSLDLEKKNHQETHG